MLNAVFGEYFFNDLKNKQIMEIIFSNKIKNIKQFVNGTFPKIFSK